MNHAQQFSEIQALRQVRRRPQRKTSFVIIVATFAWLGLATSVAFAQASSRKAFGKDNPFLSDELPAGKLKANLQALDPQAKAKAMKWLHTFDPWTSHQAVVPDTDGPVGGVYFDTMPDVDSAFINVRAEIPASAASPTGKLFGRL